MISPNEIKKVAREREIPTTTIERDYVQNQFLKQLYSRTDALVFKGGTAIRKAYISDYRFSDDLDFTLSKNIGLEEILNFVRGTARGLATDSGILFTDETIAKEVATGWKIAFHYNSALYQSANMKLIMDITCFDKESILMPVEKHLLIHTYSDECKANLTTYSLAEIAAEKLRALCDRAWPRDLYDVNTLWPLLDKSKVADIFFHKCQSRGINPSLEGYKQNKDKLKSAWSTSLEHQMKDVPDFEETIYGVLEILKTVGLI